MPLRSTSGLVPCRQHHHPVLPPRSASSGSYRDSSPVIFTTIQPRPRSSASSCHLLGIVIFMPSVFSLPSPPLSDPERVTLLISLANGGVLDLAVSAEAASSAAIRLWRRRSPSPHRRGLRSLHRLGLMPAAPVNSAHVSNADNASKVTGRQRQIKILGGNPPLSPTSPAPLAVATRSERTAVASAALQMDAASEVLEASEASVASGRRRSCWQCYFTYF